MTPEYNISKTAKFNTFYVNSTSFKNVLCKCKEIEEGLGTPKINCNDA